MTSTNNTNQIVNYDVIKPVIQETARQKIAEILDITKPVRENSEMSFKIGDKKKTSTEEEISQFAPIKESTAWEDNANTKPTSTTAQTAAEKAESVTEDFVKEEIAEERVKEEKKDEKKTPDPAEALAQSDDTAINSIWENL